MSEAHMETCNGCEVQLEGLSHVELLPALAGAQVACTLDQRSMSERARQFADVFVWLRTRTRLNAGLRWTFHAGPGVERAVRALARDEHICCPFLSFAVSTQDDSVIWDVRGTQEMIDLFADLPTALAEGGHAI